MFRMLLTVPVFNEARSLEPVFTDILGHLPREIQKVIAINDASTDGSDKILDQLAARHEIITVSHNQENKGYGYAMTESFRLCKLHNFTHVITMDCDRQHRPEDLIRFIQQPLQTDVVSGSRYMTESGDEGSAPADRVAINGRITKMLNRDYGWSLTDSFCGFKRYRIEKIDPDFFTETGYSFPLEFWPYAAAQKFSIEEIPVSRIYTTDSRSFGDDLDKQRKRYRYYIETYKNTRSRLNAPSLK